MGKRRRVARMSYELRQVVRTADNHPSGFVRSFSVLRPVVFEEGEAADVEEKMRKKLKAEVPRRDLKVFELIPPAKWCVRYVEQKGLIEELRCRQIEPTRTDIMKTTASISTPLRRLLQRTPTELELKLDAPGQYGPGKLKRDVGFQPLGWNSARARELARDKDGNVLPLARSASPIEIMAAESNVCGQGVARLLVGDRGAYAPNGRGLTARTPYILALRNPRGILDEQFRRIAEPVADAMPNLTLGDTEIYMHVDPSDTGPFEALVRSAGSVVMIDRAT